MRNVEREIAKICRKVVKKKVGDKVEGSVEITPENIQGLPGGQAIPIRPKGKKRIGSVR